MFTRTGGGDEALVSMNADGSAATTIASPLGPASPTFSPDGRRIAYTADPAAGFTSEILSISPDGTAPANLTNTPNLREEGPAWQAIFTCGGKRATIVGSDSGEKLKGTKRADVIVANGGKDKIKGKGGSDRICGGKGKDKLSAGKGKKDRCFGGKGRDSGKGCEKGKL